jgi:tetratricopeptide (TPR) repeat protein
LVSKGIPIASQRAGAKSEMPSRQEVNETLFHKVISRIREQEPSRWRYGALAASVLLAVTILALWLRTEPLSTPDPADQTAPASFVAEPAAGKPDTVTLVPSAPLAQVKFDGNVVPPDPSPLERAQEELDRGNVDRAVKLLEESIAKDPVDPSDLRVLYAAALRRQAGLFRDHDPERAEQCLSQAVAADPKNAEVYVDLGKFYTASKKYPEAIHAYEQAAALDDRSADTFFNLGFLYASTKDNERAEKMFLHVAALRPPYLDKALFNLAAVQCKQAKRQQCVESLEEALAENPNNQRARTYLRQLKGNGKGPR